MKVDFMKLKSWGEEVVRLKVSKEIGIFRLDMNKFKEALLGNNFIKF